MAIVTISRIQHRRGFYENLPQLAAAELGWAVDQRRLFIGNGPTDEGAPDIGNTEILTEYSDILSVAQAYTFKNEDAGYTPTTGPSANAPTLRTIQRKFDDFVSVKDFGAKGDGETDDTEAINRALYELYCRENFEGTRKKLYFPAGRYIISEWIKVPPYATIIGEGPYSTVIVQTADLSVYTVVFKTSDSKQQVDGAIGTNNAILPQDIYIGDLGIETNLDGFYLDKTKRITLQRIRVTGPVNFPTDSIYAEATEPAVGLWLSGSSSLPTEDVNLIDCYFSGLNYGIWQDLPGEYFQNVMISSGTFTNLYGGIYVGVSGGSCKNLVVTNTVYHNIYAEAVWINNAANFVSSFNYYRDVGNSYNGVGSPTSTVIKFGATASHSASMGDLFDRTIADAAIYPIIETNEDVSFYNYGREISLGLLKVFNGRRITLSDNATDEPTVIQFDTLKDPNAEILYTLARGSDRRVGRLLISFDDLGNYSIDDDSTETTDVGVVFDIDMSGTTATLTATTTSTGDDVQMDYSIRNLSEYVI